MGLAQENLDWEFLLCLFLLSIDVFLQFLLEPIFPLADSWVTECGNILSRNLNLAGGYLGSIPNDAQQLVSCLT